MEIDFLLRNQETLESFKLWIGHWWMVFLVIKSLCTRICTRWVIKRVINLDWTGVLKYQNLKSFYEQKNCFIFKHSHYIVELTIIARNIQNAKFSIKLILYVLLNSKATSNWCFVVFFNILVFEEKYAICVPYTNTNAIL